MELYDESTLNKNNKNKKLTNIILALIIVTVIIIIGLMVLMLMIKKDTLVVTLDGKTNKKFESILIFEDNNTQIYIPIKKVANFFGYNSYNGNYEQPSEDTSECYVQSENEVASFSLNSDIVYKKIPNSGSDYEYFQIDEPVKAIDGELCTTIDGIEKAFNVSFDYDQKNKTITVYTLANLAEYYSSKIINSGYTGIDTDFNNQKAILDNMLVVEKDKKYGVINSNTGDIILDAKYDKIKYLQHTSDFLVTSNKKVGIISKQKETKVNLIYDNIELLDYDSNLYIVTQNNKYGVIDINGNIKIYPEYTKIGIDTTNFKYNDIKNGYLLLNTLIPVQKDNLWGFFDKSGKQITDFQYSSLGYVQSTSQNSNNLLVIPEYNVIVVKKDDKYNLITLEGKTVFKTSVDSIYMNTESGEINYYMLYNGNILDISNYLGDSTTESSNSSNDTVNAIEE